MGKKGNNRDKIVTLLLMMVSLNTIYLLPYLMSTYYDPLQKAMGLVGRNADYGKLMSVYAISNIILYLPGGWIADMFDAKKLLVFSMISTGILGLWEATWPSYPLLMLIYVLWAFTTVLTYWSSSIKCINMIAGEDEQGSMFGSLEAGRGIVNLVLTTIFVSIYTYTKSITGVVIVISVVMILCGIAQFFFMPSTSSQGSTNANIKESMKSMVQAFKLPITYLLSAMIFGACVTRHAFSYYAPFLKDVLGVAETKTVIFANYNYTITNIIGASAAAFLAAKAGRSTRPMLLTGIIMMACYGVMAVLPQTKAFVIPFVLLFIMVSLGTFVYRAVYYAVIDEIGTPKNMVGSVIGIASLIGFVPDTFFLTMCGTWLDKYGTGAYRMIYITCLVCIGISFVGAFISERKVVARKKHLSNNSNNNNLAPQA